MKSIFVLSILMLCLLGSSVISAQTTQPSLVENKKVKQTGLLYIELEDGSRIVGELSKKTVRVVTEFGELQVPLKDVISIRPGINSRTQLLNQVNNLIESLSSEDFEKRDQAEKTLASMGVKIQVLITKALKSDDLDTEARTRLENILHEINQELKMQNRFMDESPQSMALEDQVKTANFTIAGRIVEREYVLKTKYGVLSLSLADIEVIRQHVNTRAAIKRILQVSGKHIFDTNTLKTKIKLKKGDVVHVLATGKINLPPWGNHAFSTPEGNPQFGGFVNAGGANVGNGGLVARLNDQVVPLGQNKQFTATEDGVLEMAIVIHQSYINGYNYTGEYQVRLRIEPTGE